MKLKFAGYTVLYDTADMLISTEAMQRAVMKPKDLPNIVVYCMYAFLMSTLLDWRFPRPNRKKSVKLDIQLSRGNC